MSASHGDQPARLKISPHGTTKTAKTATNINQ